MAQRKGKKRRVRVEPLEVPRRREAPAPPKPKPVREPEKVPA